MPKLSELVVSLWRPLSESEIRRVVGVTSNLVSKLDFVTDWRLQKACYLAEVWSIEERLCRLSGADFASWTHGPWSLHVREAAEILEAKGTLARTKQRAKRRPEAEFLKVVRTDQLAHLGEKDEEFLESVSEQVRYLEWRKAHQDCKENSSLRLNEARPAYQPGRLSRVNQVKARGASQLASSSSAGRRSKSRVGGASARGDA